MSSHEFVPGALVLVTAPGTLGFATVGTLFAAVAIGESIASAEGGPGSACWPRSTRSS